jgi:hypothetical protein
LNTDLAPKHSTRIGTSYLVWFESSNRYTVISKTLFDLLSGYLKANSEVHFIAQVQEQLQLKAHEAQQVAKDLHDFLADANATPAKLKESQDAPQMPELALTRCYQIGEYTFSIHFESDRLENLIHPQLSHFCMASPNSTSYSFSVFKKDSTLHLYKDHLAVLTCPAADFHLLQGRFALELINLLYQKQEADWLATLHASTLCNDKEAVLLIGDSGHGKSTFSAVLMAHGFDLLADDFTPLLADSLEVYRYPAGISIKEGAFQLFDTRLSNFKQLTTYTNPNKQTQVKYIPSPVDFNTAKKSFPCHKIVLVKYDAHSANQFNEVNPEEALQTLIPDSWISPKAHHAKLFMEWLKTVSFYKLTYSDTSLAIETFESLFNT